MFDWKRPCNRKVGSQGVCRVPSRFHRMLGIDSRAGGVLRWEATGEDEGRLTRGKIRTRESEPAKRTERGSLKSGTVVAAEKFVDECIMRTVRGRTSVKDVRDEYHAWLRAHPDEDDQPSGVHMGRALRRRHPEAKRSARVGDQGVLVPVYKNIGISTVYARDAQIQKEKKDKKDFDELLKTDEEIGADDIAGADFQDGKGG